MADQSDYKEWLKHIFDDLKSLGEDQKAMLAEQRVMNNTLVQNTMSLVEHIRRTDLLEEVVKEIKADRKKALEEYDHRIKPLEQQQLFIQAYWKLALLVISVLTSEAFLTAYKFITEFIKSGH